MKPCAYSGDVLFVIDSSASIGSGLKAGKAFVRRFIRTTADDSKFGLITFGSSAVRSVPFGNCYSKKTCANEVDRFNAVGGITRIDKGK